MTTVIDETCAVVETHEYRALAQGQVHATSSGSSSEALTFSYTTNSNGEVEQVTKTTWLRPSGAPAGF